VNHLDERGRRGDDPKVVGTGESEPCGDCTVA
jgi:hypothetical protein